MNKELSIEELSQLKSEVTAMIEQVDRTHRYSMSLIYGLYNRVNGTDERPQSCASCLIRKVKQLREWLDNLEKTENEKAKPKRKIRVKKQ